VRINSKTGLRARPGEPDAIFEIFKAEELPPYGDGGDSPAGDASSQRGREESLF
jgi:penicillin-binding protein 1A